MTMLQTLILFSLALISLPLFISSHNSSTPKIYAYDLQQFKDMKRFGHEFTPGCFYTLDYVFPTLLRESPYFTNNPEEADYFYVDAWMYWHNPRILNVIKEIQKIGPYWDRHGGADHIFVITADPGRCDYPETEAKKAIFLHHMGLLRKPKRYFEPCNLLTTWGAACDAAMELGLNVLKGDVIQGCHIPSQDIVVPPAPFEFVKDSGFEFFKSPYIHDELKGLNRTNLLYYSGKIDLHKDEPDAKDRPWSDAHYSFGARQTVYRMFAEAEGFVVHTTHTHDTYWRDLSSSIFCLATAGWGWGGRMKTAVTRGCIPVIIQDGIKVEFEEQLPLKDYAIRVPTWMAHKLPDILSSYVRSGKVEKMQKVLDCAWRLHWWRRPYGRAFEVVMCELKRRKLGLGAGHIRVDWELCQLHCGADFDKPIQMKETYNNV